MARNIESIARHLRALESVHGERDTRWSAVSAVRDGRMGEVFPEHFNTEYPYPMVANAIDTIARDLSEALGPLPALNCQSGNISGDRAQRFAAKRGRIGVSYWDESNLQLAMFKAGDNYHTYGMAPFIVEPDSKRKAPRIRYLGVTGAYPEFDREGRVVTFCRKWQDTVGNLVAQYPDAANQLLRNQYGQEVSRDKKVTVVRYIDDKEYVLYVQEGNIELSRVVNRLGKCPVRIAVRPSPDDQVRGQFDDVLGVQAARAIMMRLSVEGAEKTVQSPLVVPDDVGNIPVGPDAVIRTSQPGQVKRADLSIDGSTFAEMATLQQELLNGARYPGARQGALQGSVITGRGVEALMGGFDSQIKTGQIMFANMLQELTSLAFEMDEKYWPTRERTIRGTVEGTPFEDTYVPRRDIKGDYTCDVTYGFMSGMDPNRALVFLLQLRGDKVIDRATLQKHMPFDVDVNQLQANVDAEEMRDALKQGLMAWAQSIGPMVSAGQDPTSVLDTISRAIQDRGKGKTIEDTLVDSIAKMKADQEAAAAAAAEEAAQSGAPGMPGEGGLPPGVAPGQAGMGPGGKPDLQMLMAGLSGGGKPSLGASVRRAIPA